MKFNKHSINHKLLAVAALTCAVFQTSCKLPPREVFQGFQREGIVGYFAKNHLERDVIVSEIAPEAPDAPENSRPITTSVSPADEHAPFVAPGGNRQLAESVVGRPGFVYSPYSSSKLLVDVSEFDPGSLVMCPYTNKPFIVPSRGTSVVTTVVKRDKPMNKPIYPNMEERTSSNPPISSSTPPVSKPPVKTQSKPNTSNPTAIDDDGAIPYAKRIEGRPDYVYSPYASKSQIVDVSGMAADAKVRCPYTGKLFLVPAGGTPAPAPAPKKETPKEATPKPAPAPAPAPKPEPKKEEPKKVEPKPEPEKEEPKLEPKKEEPKPESVKEEPKPEPKKEEPKPEPVKEEPKKEEPKKDEGIKEGGTATGATPKATWADGKDGYVVSPYGNFLVDVRGKEGGSQMRCPFSGKLFTVPAK